MAKVVTMPKLGLTMTEGTLTKWYKSEGDGIDAGEVLFDVATDKLTNEVEATESGIVRKILVEEGDVVACLKPVAIIADASEDLSSFIGESEKSGRRIKASPAAKKLAEVNNIELPLVTATGPNGRITLEDVESYIHDSEKKIKASPMAKKTANTLKVDLSEINKSSRIMKEDVYKHLKDKNETVYDNLMETRIPMSHMRKVISSRMTHSWNLSPAVTFDIKVDVTRLQEIKDQLMDICKITYTDLFVKIIAVTLLEFPYLNSSIDNDEIILHNHPSIGVAVALESGLVVPVIQYANEKGLKQISNEVKALAEKARNNELDQDDMVGGTFTITNLGTYGIESFSPIINQPEVAILGVNTITKTPIVVDGEIVIKPLMTLSLTADHRVVDGAVAAQFLAKVKEYIEKPEILLL